MLKTIYNMTLKKKLYKYFRKITWDIYDRRILYVPKIRLDFYFCRFDLFPENVKELILDIFFIISGLVRISMGMFLI